jgi:hypothetical protein
LIPNIEISGIGTTIAASGRIIGLPDVNKAYFDLDIKTYNLVRKILLVLPKGTIQIRFSCLQNLMQRFF